MADIVDLEIQQGSEYIHVFQYREADKTTVIPLTGYSARCQIRPTVESSTLLFDGTTVGGELSINAAAGEVTLTVDAATSSAWTDTEAVYDLEVVDGSNIPTRIAQGSVIIDPEVTR